MHRIVWMVLLLTAGAWAASSRPAASQPTSSPKAAPNGWKQQAEHLQPLRGPSSNFIQSTAAAGDSLWLGPVLTLYLDRAAERTAAPGCADSPEEDARDCFLQVDAPAFTESNNVVFGLDVASADTIWAGLAFATRDGTAGAGGFLVSRDGGATFERTRAQLDGAADTLATYGANALPAIPIVEEANSAPQAIDRNPRTGRVWVAGGQSGLRWSEDGGQTWQRAVLPPDTSTAITPAQDLSFTVGPPVDADRGFLNHVAFSVLVDERGVVWAGTPDGLNRSDSLFAGGGRSWQHLRFDGRLDGLTGASVVALAEQPRPDRRNPVWIASWAGGGRDTDRPERFGVTVTDDGGETYRQALIGEQVFDFAFRGRTVYAAAGQSGLFVSGNGGRRWRSVAAFPLSDASDTQTLPRDVQVRSVSTTSEALWLGTSDGLLRLPRPAESDLLRGEAPTWTLFRTLVPVNPETPTDAAPDVETYAYPNPFSPADADVVRIRIELEEATAVDVSILDFGMNRVRTFTRRLDAGQQEVVWDGTDERGLRLPNGPYFYTVDTGSQTVRGKILLVE